METQLTLPHPFFDEYAVVYINPDTLPDEFKPFLARLNEKLLKESQDSDPQTLT